MYLYVGNDVLINSDNIIGIFDMDNTTISKSTRKFLNLNEKNGRIINVSYELPKSFVVCKDKSVNDKKIYLCKLSPATIQGRKDVGF